MAERVQRAFTRLRLACGLPVDAVARLDYARQPIWIGISSALEYHTRALSCAKEPEMVAWIEEEFRPGDVFYDVGANVGAYSLVAAARWEGMVRVVAVEPSAINFMRLTRNLSLNACGAHVVALPVALGAATGIETFHYASLEAGGALHALGEAKDYRGRPFAAAARSAVLAFALDELIEQFKLPPPTHLKLDVDGTELAILQGASRSLAGERSVFVELEVEHPLTPQVRALLRSHGLQETASYPCHIRGFEGVSNVIFHRAPAGERVRAQGAAS
jgi:FkbM family methyltransferase